MSARNRGCMIAVVGSQTNEATIYLVSSWRKLGLDARLVSGERLAAEVDTSDIVLGRLDVLDTLDGIEPGLLDLFLLEQRGVRVLNGARALLAAHDKLRTARVLEAARLPTPRTAHVRGAAPLPFGPPYVVKPRFGSWGRDVFVCDDGAALGRCLAELRERPWFKRHGALIQELIPNDGRDIRLVVAGGRIVGVGERTAAPGEWRTNVSCGGTLAPTELDPDAAELARAAAAVTGADFVGIDVMPTPDGRLVVLELNGAVEFDEACTIGGSSVPERAATALRIAWSPVLVG